MRGCIGWSQWACQLWVNSASSKLCAPSSYLNALILHTRGACFRCLVAQSCPTLCDPVDCSTPGFPVCHYLLEFAQTHVHWVNDAIQPSRPLSPLSPPAFNLFKHQKLFQWVGSSVLPMNMQGWFQNGVVCSMDGCRTASAGVPVLACTAPCLNPKLKLAYCQTSGRSAQNQRSKRETGHRGAGALSNW